MEDVERHFPGLIRATNEWFRIYKIPDGKPENHFAFSGEAKNKKYALDVVSETHEAWKRLIRGEVPNSGDGYSMDTTNTTIESTPGYVGADSFYNNSIPKNAGAAAQPVDPSSKCSSVA